MKTVQELLTEADIDYYDQKYGKIFPHFEDVDASQLYPKNKYVFGGDEKLYKSKVNDADGSSLETVEQWQPYDVINNKGFLLIYVQTVTVDFIFNKTLIEDIIVSSMQRFPANQVYAIKSSNLSETQFENYFKRAFLLLVSHNLFIQGLMHGENVPETQTKPIIMGATKFTKVHDLAKAHDSVSALNEYDAAWFNQSSYGMEYYNIIKHFRFYATSYGRTTMFEA